jgi:thioredoxin 1
VDGAVVAPSEPEKEHAAMNQLSDNNFRERIADTAEGIVIFYKELCPHCKNMEKVLEKFSAAHPHVALHAVNLEKNPESASMAGVARAPTILVINDGEIRASRAGLMNFKEMNAFYTYIPAKEFGKKV